MQILMRMLLLAIVCSYTVTGLSGCAKKAPPPQSPIIGSRFRTPDSEAPAEYSEPVPPAGYGPYAGYNGAPPANTYSSPAPAPAPQVSVTPARPGSSVVRESKAPARPLWRRNSYKWVKDNEYHHLGRNGPASAGGSSTFAPRRKNPAKKDLSVW